MHAVLVKLVSEHKKDARAVSSEQTETISAVKTIPEEHSSVEEVEKPGCVCVGGGGTERSRLEEYILEELKAIRLDVQAINDRVAFPEDRSNGNNGPRAQCLPNSSAVPATNLTQNDDVGAEYAVIRAALQSVGLPSKLTLPAETGTKHVKHRDKV